MSCISSQMNDLTGQDIGPRRTNRAFRDNTDRVKFVRTGKIELGRSSEIHF